MPVILTLRPHVGFLLTGIRIIPISSTNDTASGVKVWVLTGMVALTMGIVSFFAVRLVDTIDSTENSVNTIKEVQARQEERITSLQRDRDNAEKEIERLKSQVDRLKDDNAELKGKLKVSSSLDTSKAASGQLFSFLHNR